MTSVLAGRYCPIDASDASGMNLMDIRYVGMFRGGGGHKRPLDERYPLREIVSKYTVDSIENIGWRLLSWDS